MTRVRPGHTYASVAIGGKLVRVEVSNAVPDRWACRRVVDFPAGRIPADAGRAACSLCGEAIVFNPARAVDAPKVCLQCEGIEPEPFEVPS